MTFYVSSRVTLLFDFWDVDGPVGECDTAGVNALLANVENPPKNFSYSLLQHSLH